MTWEPIFDGQPISSIGAISVAPSNLRLSMSAPARRFSVPTLTYGNGVYKSTDGGAPGRNWPHRVAPFSRMPLIRTIRCRIRRGMGSATPGAERGIFSDRTDGGSTWQKVLFKDEKHRRC